MIKEKYYLKGSKKSSISCEGTENGVNNINIKASGSCSNQNLILASDFVKHALNNKETDIPICVEHGLLTDEKIPVLFCYPESTEKLPVVFLIHGAWSQKNNQLGNAITLAEQGYFIILPDLRMHGERRPDDYEVRFSKGHVSNYFFGIIKETSDDVIRLIDYISNDPRVDIDRIGMTGFSMGGYTTLLTIQREKRIKAAAPIAGSPDWNITAKREDFYPVSKDIQEFINQYNPADFYQKFHPTALLVQNGEADEDVSIEGSKNLDSKLIELYKDIPERYKFISYPGLKHEVDPLMIVRLIEWFKKYL